MSKSLIIAEKASLAKNAVAACELLGDKLIKKNGYYEGKEYIVSYGAGHLFSLYDIEEYIYGPNKKKTYRWIETADKLPYIPDTFKFKIKEGCERQYEVLKMLINRSDVDSIYNLGDADREGEIIIRTIVSHALNGKKNIYRIWGADQTKEELARCIRLNQPDYEFDDIAKEGYSRMYMDWLLGINVTRMLSLSMNGRGQLRVGRVLVPIVKEIYDRDKSIKEFKPETYFQAESHTLIDCIPLDLVLKNPANDRKTREEVEKECKELNESKLFVKSILVSERVKKAPKLFSLSKLQAFMGSEYKWSPDETLSICQELYLDGFISYPRTNTEYMSEGETDKVSEVIKAHMERAKGGLILKTDKSIFDSKKVESHSAITPTNVIPKELGNDKRKLLYDTICNRFYANFCKEEMYVNTEEIVIGNDTYEFKVIGERVSDKGWSIYEEGKSKEKQVPKLEIADEISTSFIALAKTTTPPKRHTVESLLGFLNNPFKKENQGEDEEYRDKFKGIEIGTEATRAGIIKNALDCGYLKHKEGQYFITPLGEYLIESLYKCKINLFKEKSVEFSKMLVEVRKGYISADTCIEYCSDELNYIKENIKGVNLSEPPVYGGSKKEAICECPYCKAADTEGGLIYEGQNNFYCCNATKTKDYKCDFSLSKSAHEKLTGKSVTPSQVKQICKRGYIEVTGKRKNKLTLYLTQNGKYTNLSF